MKLFGRYQTGWGVLERGLCGLAAFAVNGGDEDISLLRTAVVSRLTGTSAPEQEIRDRTAREILERVANLYRQGHWWSQIEMAIAKSDHAKLGPLLKEIASLLSPGMARLTPTI